MISRILAVAAVIALNSGQSVSAATFDFTGFVGTSQIPSATYSSGGVSIEALASDGSDPTNLVQAPSPGATSANLGFYLGLGVSSNTGPTNGIDLLESITFSLPTGYFVSSITLTQDVDSTQDQEVLLFVDGTSVGGGSVTLSNDTTTDGRTVFMATETLGSIFSVSSGTSNDSGFWINALTVDLATPSAVPLPAGFILLGSALAAGSMVGRRRKAKWT